MHIDCHPCNAQRIMFCTTRNKSFFVLFCFCRTLLCTRLPGLRSRVEKGDMERGKEGGGNNRIIPVITTIAQNHTALEGGSSSESVTHSTAEQRRNKWPCRTEIHSTVKKSCSAGTDRQTDSRHSSAFGARYERTSET